MQQCNLAKEKKNTANKKSTQKEIFTEKVIGTA